VLRAGPISPALLVIYRLNWPGWAQFAALPEAHGLYIIAEPNQKVAARSQVACSTVGRAAISATARGVDATVLVVVYYYY
jgi:hypothetical protein